MKHLQSNSELQEKALLYAIGALPEEERRDYVRHLEEDDCKVCVAESLEFQNVAQTLAIDVPAQTPSAAVKARLMAQVRAESSTAPRPQDRPQRKAWQWIGWPVAAAAAAALVITLNLNVGLRRQVDALATRVTQLEGEVSSNQEKMVALTEGRVIDLAGQGSAPQARGRIFWDQTARVWRVYLRNLPPVSADKAYQLWFVPQKGNPLSAQVFNTQPDGRVMLEFQLPPGATALMAAAVTTEPAGGLPQPTGAFVLAGM